MTFIHRIICLWKADVHGILDHLENKELLLKQALRDMEQALGTDAAKLKHMQTALNRAKQAFENQAKQLTQIESDIGAAIQKEKDDIARLLLRKRYILADHHETLNHEIQRMEIDIAEADKTLQSRRLQYEHIQLRAACFDQNQKDMWPHTDLLSESSSGQHLPWDEEIDIELAQRKKYLKGEKP